MMKWREWFRMAIEELVQFSYENPWWPLAVLLAAGILAAIIY